MNPQVFSKPFSLTVSALASQAMPSRLPAWAGFQPVLSRFRCPDPSQRCSQSVNCGQISSQCSSVRLCVLKCCLCCCGVSVAKVNELGIWSPRRCEDSGADMSYLGCRWRQHQQQKQYQHHQHQSQKQLYRNGNRNSNRNSSSDSGSCSDSGNWAESSATASGNSTIAY